MECTLHSSILEVASRITLTNLEREAILSAATALQAHLDAFPILGFAVVVLAPAEQAQHSKSTASGSCASPLPQDLRCQLLSKWR